jgi:DNA/RNA endonuclease YhcR with UshA esterase domain
MTKIHSLFFVGITSMLIATPGASHHSFSAEFDVGRPVSITGTVSQIEWTNPHAWIFVDTEDDQGNIENWAVEMLGINALMRSGINPRTLKAGDVITVEGYGSRDGSNTANASLVMRTSTGETLWASARNDRD